MFDLNRTVEMERCLELQADMKLLIDSVAELINLRAAAIRYIVDGAPDGSKASEYKNYTTERLAELVKEIRDNF